MSDFKKLDVWKRTHRFTLAIYKATETFPKHELFGLTSQLRRATSSIGCNMAEGLARGTDREVLRFLRIATGSLGEVEYELLLARDLGYLSAESYETLRIELKEIARMLAALVKRISQRTVIHEGSKQPLATV